jgi:hypothetical protein
MLFMWSGAWSSSCRSGLQHRLERCPASPFQQCLEFKFKEGHFLFPSFSFLILSSCAGSAASLRRAFSATSGFISGIYGRITAFFATVYAIWTSWPGVLFRWVTATLIVSTVLANALVVPFLNARAVPIVEGRFAQVAQRAVSMHGIRWISPPGIVGVDLQRQPAQLDLLTPTHDPFAMDQTLFCGIALSSFVLRSLQL